jgi:hypothetical protein
MNVAKIGVYDKMLRAALFKHAHNGGFIGYFVERGSFSGHRKTVHMRMAAGLNQPTKLSF